MIDHLRARLMLTIMMAYGGDLRPADLPGWFRFLFDLLEPGRTPRQVWCDHYGERMRFCSLDMVTTDKRVVFEDGEWWCYTTPRRDFHRELLLTVQNAYGLPRYLFEPLRYDPPRQERTAWRAVAGFSRNPPYRHIRATIPPD